MLGSEYWDQVVIFVQAVPPWFKGLPVWMWSLLILAVGYFMGRMVRTRATKLQQQQSARDATRLAIEAMRLDPTFQAVPGLGQLVLDQLKRQPRLKVPPELEKRLKGKAGAEAAATQETVAAESEAPAPEAETKAEAEAEAKSEAKVDAEPEAKSEPEAEAPSEEKRKLATAAGDETAESETGEPEKTGAKSASDADRRPAAAAASSGSGFFGRGS